LNTIALASNLVTECLNIGKSRINKLMAFCRFLDILPHAVTRFGDYSDDISK